MAATTLKLLIDNKSKRVVYAEAGKDFVDFLFGLMQLPLGTIMGSLLENCMPAGSGSLGSIYKSVMLLSSSHLQPNVSKDVVLKPKLSLPVTIDSVPLLKNFVSRKRKHESSYYGQYGTYGAAKARRVDPSSSKRGAATSSKEEQGFVSGLVKYIVMDSLTVMPISTFPVISLLKWYRVKDFSSLEEKTVVINFNKVWSWLRLHLHRTQSSIMYSSESPSTSRRNYDHESILLDFMRDPFLTDAK